MELGALPAPDLCWWPWAPASFLEMGDEPGFLAGFILGCLGRCSGSFLLGASMGCGEDHPEVVPTCWALSTPWALGPPLQPTQDTEGTSLPTGPWTAWRQPLRTPATGDQEPPWGCPLGPWAQRGLTQTKDTRGNLVFPPATLTVSFSGQEKLFPPDLNILLRWALNPCVPSSDPWVHLPVLAPLLSMYYWAGDQAQGRGFTPRALGGS